MEDAKYLNLLSILTSQALRSRQDFTPLLYPNVAHCPSSIKELVQFDINYY